MPTLSLVWGVIAFLGLIVTLLPPLQPLNWIILPFSGLAVLLNLYVILAPKFRRDPLGIAGLVAGGVAFIVAIIRVTINPGQI